MSCYNINIFDMYIKKEYRPFITEVFGNKDWRLFPDDRIHRLCDRLDERDTALLFSGTDENGWLSHWDEETGRLRFNKHYNVRSYCEAYSYLNIYRMILPEYCEDGKMCFHVFWDEADDDYNRCFVADLKSGRHATLGYILDKLCDDSNDYERLTESWHCPSSDEQTVQGIFLLEYGAVLSPCTEKQQRQLTENPTDNARLITLDELLGEDGTLDIPEYVKEIAPYTFKGCKQLKRVLFSQRSLTLAHHAFALCPALEEVSFAHHPESKFMSEFHATVSEAAFSGCIALKKVQLPKWSRRIQPYTFFGCVSLEQISLPAGKEECTQFAEKKGLLVDIHDEWQREAICLGLASVGDYAFSLCRNLTGLRLPDGLQLLREGAFSGCTALQQIELPNTLQELQAQAFSRCTSLEKVQLPEGLYSLGEGAFNDCSSLAEITIPRSTEVFGVRGGSVTEMLSCAVFHSSAFEKGRNGWDQWCYSPLAGLTILCPKSSAAEFYARYNGIRFRIVEDKG